jgi:hypothetical protein
VSPFRRWQLVEDFRSHEEDEKPKLRNVVFVSERKIVAGAKETHRERFHEASFSILLSRVLSITQFMLVDGWLMLSC